MRCMRLLEGMHIWSKERHVIQVGLQWATGCKAVSGVGMTVVLVVCVSVGLRLV